MTMPGFVTGQPLSGQGVGQAIFQFLPCLLGEGPPGMPRAMARVLYPRGFNPLQPFPVVAPAAPPAAPLIPPAAPAAPPVVPAPAVDARGNQIQRRQPLPAAIPQPAPPAPRKRVLERGTFPEWH